MEAAGVIEPSYSEWASPPVLVRKRDGGVRWCIDYRKLNTVTRKDVYPLPNIDECLDTLSGNTWFSKLDANSAYWQVKIREEDRKKTAFTTKYGLYEFARMGFGLCNAPATFSRAMDLILRGLTWEVALAFLDDVVVLGKDFPDHVRNLQSVLQRFSDFHLKLKPKKCELFQQQVEFLGREVGKNQIRLKPDHVEAVANWPIPRTTKQVESFLGLVNYHRNFIQGHAEVAVPLYQITGKNKFRWGVEQQQAFEKIKDLLVTAPVLTMPNGQDPFVLDTDASNEAIGAELLQIQSGQERVIAYGSVSLSPEQRRYCVTRRELLAVVKFTRQYRHYLLGKPITVRTDHHSLVWLMNFKNPQGQLARWLEELSQYEIRLVHRPGEKHMNADALSRIPGEEPTCEAYRLGFRLKDLPCQGCTYCSKAHSNWSPFVEEVDDVVPLATRPQRIQAVGGEGAPAQGHPGPVVQGEPEAQPPGDDPGPGGGPVGQVPSPLAHLREEQVKDDHFKALREWLKTGQEPEQGTQMLWSPAEKYLWVNREQFCLEQDIICMVRDEEEVVLVPKSLREEVLQLCHNIPSAGHAGRERTKAKLRNKFYWYGMTKDVKEYLQSCATCNQSKKNTLPGRMPMRSYHAGAPMERVHLDILGPLPRTEQGYEYVMVMVDQFTKWVEVAPLTSQTAEETARAAVETFFSRFGYPFEIFTDQGRNFESRLFAGMCKMLHIHKARTTPYRPSANGQVERYNRTLMDAVRCYVGKDQANWAVYLSQIAGAMRSTVNRSTGFTPNRLMLGRETCQPVEVVYPLPRRALAGKSEDKFCAELRAAMETAHETARRTLRSTQKVMKRDYDLRTRQRSFQEDDSVYILNTAQLKGQCKKLNSPWKDQQG